MPHSCRVAVSSEIEVLHLEVARLDRHSSNIMHMK